MRNENSHKGFPCTLIAGQKIEVADAAENCYRNRNEMRLHGTRWGVEGITAPSLRVQPLCAAADISGDGRCGQDNAIPERHVRHVNPQGLQGRSRSVIRAPGLELEQ